MCRENGVAVADYTVHIIFCPLEHVTEVVSFCLFVFLFFSTLPLYILIMELSRINMIVYISNKVSVKSHAYVV